MKATTATAAPADGLVDLLVLGDRVRARWQNPGALNTAELADHEQLRLRVDPATRAGIETMADLHARAHAFAERLNNDPRPMEADDELERAALERLISSEPLKGIFMLPAQQKKQRDRVDALRAVELARKQEVADRWRDTPLGQRLLWIARDRAADEETRRLLGVLCELLEAGDEAIRALPPPAAFGKPRYE